MATKQVMEEVRGYARSERHMRHFQAWASSLSPSLNVKTLEDDASSTSDADATPKKLFSLLRTDMLGGMLLFSEALPSTQTLLHETLRPNAPAGVVCYTTHQLQGKGRGANTWVSPEGCLTFSFKSVFTEGNTLPFVQYLVSLAIVQAVEAVQGTVGASPVRIKWPNDIYVDTVKIGGILCQSEYKDGAFNVTTGIGINISNRSPTICLQDVLSTEQKLCTVTKEEFLAAFCNAFEPMEQIFQTQGFSPFKSAYLERWLHSNQTVQVASNTDNDAPKTTALIKGLTDTGCLLADADGEALELYPDGNSFDFLSGLLKRKL